LELNSTVTFDWEGTQIEGTIEKEYENSVLISVINPSMEIKDKYLGRLVVSKKSVSA
jgi:hypothetical protein